MEKCNVCGTEMYPIQAVDDGDDEKLCISCARERYPNEEAFMTPEEVEAGPYLQPMTVQQLIEKLQSYNTPDKVVMLGADSELSGLSHIHEVSWEGSPEAIVLSPRSTEPYEQVKN